MTPDTARDATIRVAGIGRAEAAADRCILNLNLRASAESTGGALTALSEVVTRTIASLHEEGIAAGDIRTLNVTVDDRWDRSHERLVGRSAAYRLRVVVPGLDQAGALLSKLAEVAGDYLNVEGIELTVRETDELARSARRAAVLDAQARAGELAAAAGVALGELLEIEEGATQGEGGPRRGGLRLSAASAAPIPPVPIESGPLSVTSVVILVYRLG